jgi:hypothetical protein
MQLNNQTDHIAILALMMAGILIKRLDQTGHLDEPTAEHLHRLVLGVRAHAKHAGLTDLNVLFDNIDNSLSERRGVKSDLGRPDGAPGRIESNQEIQALNMAARSPGAH